MKKLIILIIVFYSFCFIEKADAQTCTNCVIYGETFDLYGTYPFSYNTDETSRTLAAAYEVFTNELSYMPECSNNCCTNSSSWPWIVCTDGGMYYGDFAYQRGDWDVSCHVTYTDTDTDGILDDGDCSNDFSDNTCTAWNTENCDDNCILISNADQADSDEDGVGDVCDNCPANWNPVQWDNDGDSTGDACDSEPDLDNDGVADTYDNCPDVPNHSQHDFDADGSGNACDPVLDGNYTLNNEGDVTAMAGITEVTGNLYILSKYALTSLNGLESLTSVNGDLQITKNFSLTSLSGIESLTSVGKGLNILYNHALPSLSGLENLTSVGTDLKIIYNDALISLNGLDSITSVGGISISNNDYLGSLIGLENITSVGRDLIIYDNDGLTSLTGLHNITSVGEDLKVSYNDSLTNLSELYGIQLVDGPLGIYNNTNICMETAHALEYRLRSNGFSGTANIHDNNGTICPPEIADITTNQGPDEALIPLAGEPTFSLASEQIQWIPSDPDALPETGEMWEKTLGIAHSYISYWTYEMSDYSPEVELILNDDVIGYFGRWKWFSPAAYLPNDGLFWVKLISEDTDSNRSEVIRQIRVNTTDTDEDSIPDTVDNCPDNCNTQQLDADEDGIGDVCDTEDDGCDGCGNGTICEQEC
jgi:hypothetical protein